MYSRRFGTLNNSIGDINISGSKRSHSVCILERFINCVFGIYLKILIRTRRLSQEDFKFKANM